MQPKDEQRFWGKVVKGAPGECWTFSGGHNKDGYGRFVVGRTAKLAHRIAFILANGPIQDGMVMDHLCRNPGCCNPDHLEAVPQSENVLRGMEVRNGSRDECPQGHPFKPENTANYKGRRECRVCIRQRCREYGKRRDRRNSGVGL